MTGRDFFLAIEKAGGTVGLRLPSTSAKQPTFWPVWGLEVSNDFYPFLELTRGQVLVWISSSADPINLHPFDIPRWVAEIDRARVIDALKKGG